METTYDFKRADDTSALLNFKCGIKAMDDFIHDKENGLAKFVKLRLSNLWIVFQDNKAVAFFALSKDALTLNNDDRRNMECYEEKTKALVPEDDIEKFWNKDKYPAIEIDYLAVSEELRNNPNVHLGSLIIAAIAKKASQDRLSATLFITVEALDTPQYSTVNFYQKCGFDFSEVAQNKYNYDVMCGSQPTTKRMYKIVIP